MELRGAGLCAVVVTIAAASGAMADPPERHAEKLRLVLIGVMTRHLDAVRVSLERMCEPRCGQVFLEPSNEFPLAAREHVQPGISRIRYNQGVIASMFPMYHPSVLYAIVAHEYRHQLDDVPGTLEAS